MRRVRSTSGESEVKSSGPMCFTELSLFLYRNYSCGLSEIEPLSGFKWVDDWTVIVKDNVTDPTGYVCADQLNL